MTGNTGTGPADAVAEAVQRAFAAAQYNPEEHASAITPLEALIAEQGLIVEEVDELSHHSAGARLAAYGFGVQPGGSTDTTLSGYLFASAAGGMIFVNRDAHNPLVRRRFTIAHELGHYLLHFLPLLQAAAAPDELAFTEAIPAGADEAAGIAGDVHVRGDGQGLTPTPRDPRGIEEEADAFAATVLMPAVICRSLVLRLSPQCGRRRAVLARRLAPEFLVSRTAMERRLDDLHLGEGAG